MDNTLVGLIFLVSYLGILLVLGGLAARQQNSPADFWVAGRRFGVGMMIITSSAAMLHGGSL
jgi:Na+/proline symporter